VTSLGSAVSIYYDIERTHNRSSTISEHIENLIVAYTVYQLLNFQGGDHTELLAEERGLNASPTLKFPTND